MILMSHLKKSEGNVKVAPWVNPENCDKFVTLPEQYKSLSDYPGMLPLVF